MSKTIKRKIREIVYLVMELNEVTHWELKTEICERKITIWDFRNNDCKHYIDHDMGSIYFKDREGQAENEIDKVLEKLKRDLINQRIKNKEEVKCLKLAL